jgi:hypothetical protein
MVVKTELYFDLAVKVSPEDLPLIRSALQNVVETLISRIKPEEYNFEFLEHKVSPRWLRREEVISLTLGQPKRKVTLEGIPPLLLKELELLDAEEESDANKETSSVSPVKGSSVRQSDLIRKKN